MTNVGLSLRALLGALLIRTISIPSQQAQNNPEMPVQMHRRSLHSNTAYPKLRAELG